MAKPEPVRIFIGCDRSQLIGARLLDFSIRRRTNLDVQTRLMHDLDLPEPKSSLNRSRTGFSFSRFAIPELAGRKGKAIYLDADMLVFKDIAELWHFPFNDAKVVCQEEPSDHGANSTRRRRKQCSVMLLDCERLGWDVKKIVTGLDGIYNYSQLMDELCILDETEVSYDLPSRWNSLEHWDEDTSLIHYTDMLTQPWVCAANPNGHLWVQELREALQAGVLSLDDLKEEVALGFARPSLLVELENTTGRLCAADSQRMTEIDKKARFKAHGALVDALHRREDRAVALVNRAVMKLKRALRADPAV